MTSGPNSTIGILAPILASIVCHEGSHRRRDPSARSRIGDRLLPGDAAMEGSGALCGLGATSG